MFLEDIVLRSFHLVDSVCISSCEINAHIQMRINEIKAFIKERYSKKKEAAAADSMNNKAEDIN